MSTADALRLLVYADDAPFYAQALHDRFGARLLVQATTDRAQAQRLLPGQQVLVVPAPRIDDVFLAQGQALQWVHALTSGVETLLTSRVLPAGTIVTSSRGIHGPQMAETALLMMLALVRNLPRMLANQAQARWERWAQPLLHGKHVVVVGAGSAGQALAPLCKAMGMRVTGVASARRELAHFDVVHPRAELAQVLGDADFVVVLVPLDDTTRGLFNAAMLAALPPHAILVNLSRGGVVDEAALLDALCEGRLGGAGMDVFATEPLPADDPLWRAPNLLITPHIGGFSDIYAQQALGLLLANVQAFAGGRDEALVNRMR
jgi:D-2-hydroxyacid dehydrogenase (NADP+)